MWHYYRIMHKNSKLLFDKYARRFFGPESSVLEIGPDKHPSTYGERIDFATGSWDTLDVVDRPDVPLTYVANSEYSFPIADNTYDIIFSGQVIEHVRKIWRWMPELARVCRPGGLVITINPVSWHYHEAPVDCWRIYPEGMTALCEDAGLEMVLSRFESVEMEKFRRIVPGVVHRQHVFQRVSGLFGMMNAVFRFPVEAAFDTITVARKPEVS